MLIPKFQLFLLPLVSNIGPCFFSDSITHRWREGFKTRVKGALKIVPKIIQQYIFICSYEPQYFLGKNNRYMWQTSLLSHFRWYCMLNPALLTAFSLGLLWGVQYLTTPLPNHTCTSLFTLVQYHALSIPALIYQVF